MIDAAQAGLEPDPEITMQLVGNERQDEATICRWVARSYGEFNRAYYEAYSKETLKKIKEQLASANGHQQKKRSWF